jgi:hypothetical protein
MTAASPQQEKIICVWLNSTLGLMAYWIESNRNQDGRGGITVTAIPDISLLDVTKLNTTQLEKKMLPANEAWRTSSRQDLDFQ